MFKVIEEDRRDVKKYNVKIIEILKCVGFEEVYWLGYLLDNFDINIVIGYDIKLGWFGYVIRRLCGVKWVYVVYINVEEVGIYRNREGEILRGEDK